MHQNYKQTKPNYGFPKSCKKMVETLTTQQMMIYTCSCGKQILIVPDVRKMSKAINDHVIEHNKSKRKQPLKEETITQEIIKTIIETEQMSL